MGLSVPHAPALAYLDPAALGTVSLQLMALEVAFPLLWCLPTKAPYLTSCSWGLGFTLIFVTLTLTPRLPSPL